MRVRLDKNGAGPSNLRHCYMCDSRESVRRWLYRPPMGGDNPGQPPHHRVCGVCRASLANGSLVKQDRVSRCGVDYQCPDRTPGRDGACSPNGC
jgi:hypothetical protein